MDPRNLYCGHCQMPMNGNAVVVNQAHIEAKKTGIFTAAFHGDSLRARFVRGALWSLAGAVISQGLALLVSLATARLLGKVSFGELGIIQNTVATFGVFAGMGLGLTGTKYVAELRSSNRERASQVIGLVLALALCTSALASLVLATLSPWIAAFVLNAPHLSEELRISSCLIVFNVLLGTQLGVLAGFEAFRTIARVGIVRGFVTFATSIIAVLLWQLPGAVWALVVSTAVACILTHSAIRSECTKHRIQLQWRKYDMDPNILWGFSLPAFLSSALPALVIWSTNVILVSQPFGYGEMGIFNAANQWRAAVSFLPSILSQPLLPMLSTPRVDAHGTAFKRLLGANLLLAFSLSASVALPLTAGSSWIMKGYGAEFASGRKVFVLLIAVAVISSTGSVIVQAITSLNKMWLILFLNCAWATALVAFAQKLVPSHGAEGLAQAFLFACGLHSVAVSLYAARQLRGPWKRRTKAMLLSADQQGVGL